MVASLLFVEGSSLSSYTIPKPKSSAKADHTIVWSNVWSKCYLYKM